MPYPASNMPGFRQNLTRSVQHQSHAEPDVKGQRRKYSPPWAADKPYGIRRACASSFHEDKEEWGQCLSLPPFHCFFLCCLPSLSCFAFYVVKVGVFTRYSSGLQCFVDFRRWIYLVVSKQILPPQSQRAHFLYHCTKDTRDTDFTDSFLHSVPYITHNWVTL